MRTLLLSSLLRASTPSRSSEIRHRNQLTAKAWEKAVQELGNSHPKKAKIKDVRANCFCASLLRTTARANSHATSCIERALQVLKWIIIGQMAVAIALLGFNTLGRSVTPTFLFRNGFYLQLSPHWSKMNKKSMWEVKKISRFLSKGHGIQPSCGCKAR